MSCGRLYPASFVKVVGGCDATSLMYSGEAHRDAANRHHTTNSRFNLQLFPRERRCPNCIHAVTRYEYGRHQYRVKERAMKKLRIAIISVNSLM